MTWVRISAWIKTALIKLVQRVRALYEAVQTSCSANKLQCKQAAVQTSCSANKLQCKQAAVQRSCSA